jgi:hypothetical protein
VLAILLWTLWEDTGGVLARQVDQFGKQVFLCSDLNLEELLTTTTPLSPDSTTCPTSRQYLS